MSFRRFKLMLKSWFLLISASCFFLFSACDESIHTGSVAALDDGALSVAIVYHGAEGNHQRSAAGFDCEGEGVATVEARVYDSENNNLVMSDPWDCNAGHAIIESVPAGSDLTVVILGKDSEENVVFYGQKTGIEVVANENNDAGTIECNAFFPNPITPIDESLVAENHMVLEWTPVTGAFEYHIVISDNHDVSSPIIEDHTIEKIYAPSGLSIDKTYYWQVYAEDGYNNRGPGSKVRSFTAAAPGTVATGKLPDTGQSGSYTDQFGEDSDYDINPPIYTKLNASGDDLDAGAGEWAMVRDDVTGLIWEVKTDDDTVHDKDNTYTWQESQDAFIAELNRDTLGGCNNWRLPTIKELATLTNYNSHRPAINMTYFINTQPVAHWSSTETSSLDGYVWTSRAAHGGNIRNLKSESLPVRAVCGEPKAYDLNNLLVDNGDGTVTDARTGLMWQKAAAPEPVIWENALIYCEELDLGGHEDWRLPNISELRSIIDYRRNFPSIETAIFARTDPNAFWSSTHTMPPSQFDYKWIVDYDSGLTSYTAPDTEEIYVRAVRGGQ